MQYLLQMGGADRITLKKCKVRIITCMLMENWLGDLCFHIDTIPMVFRRSSAEYARERQVSDVYGQSAESPT